MEKIKVKSKKFRDKFKKAVKNKEEFIKREQEKIKK